MDLEPSQTFIMNESSVIDGSQSSTCKNSLILLILVLTYTGKSLHWYNISVPQLGKNAKMQE